MRNAPVRTSFLAVGLVVCVTLPLAGQAGAPQARQSTPPPVVTDATAVTQGAVLFRQECVFCHGVSARGGMRGPDLTTGAWSHGGSDEELAATISGGVPGTAMPAHAHLTPEEIGQIVAYLRTLQQPVTPSTGRRHARRDAVLRRRALWRVSPREGPRRQGRPGAHHGGFGAVARLSHRVHSRARALPDRARGDRRGGSTAVRHGDRRDERRPGRSWAWP